MIDSAEWGDYRNQFSAWDANQDGLIDEDEWDVGSETAFGGAPGGGNDDDGRGPAAAVTGSASSRARGKS